MLFGVVVGCLASILAIIFVESFTFLYQAIIGKAVEGANSGDFNIWLLILPVVGGLIVGALLHSKKETKLFTLADLIGRTQSQKPMLSWLETLRNALASILSIAFGASVGPYAPIANMGGNIGALISRFGRAEVSLGVGCGVAAAISTAFSAPIAGIIFAHEVILRHYSLRAFAPITVASSVGFFISNYLFHRPPLLEVHGSRSIFAPEILGFVLVGIVGALVAVAFMRSILFFLELAKRLSLPDFLKPAFAGLGIGLMAQWIPEILGVGTAVQKAALIGQQWDVVQLLIILVAKILATSLCIGFGFAGGVFSPSLLVGILLGAALGHVAGWVYGDMSSGPVFYAVCGMVAVTSPIIGAPLTTILIVFELTRDYELTTAAMVSVVFSNVVAYRLFGRSLFDFQLKDQGLDLSMGRDQVVLQQTGIQEFVQTDFVNFSPESSVNEAHDRMMDNQITEGYVVDDLGKLVGKLDLHGIIVQLEAGQTELPVAAAMNTVDLCFEQSDSVWGAMQKIRDINVESIPIVDQRGYFIGIIRPSSIVDAYLRIMQSLRAEEHAAN